MHKPFYAGNEGIIIRRGASYQGIALAMAKIVAATHPFRGWAFAGLAIPGRTLCGDRALIGDALLECDGDVGPHLEGEYDGGRQKQRSDGDVDYGRNHHRQFGLGGVSSPHDAGDEGEKAEAELRHHQSDRKSVVRMACTMEVG